MNIGNLEFKPRLYPSLFFIAILPVLISLGLWQMERAVEKQELIDVREVTLESAPIDLNVSPELFEEDLYRRATIEGVFDGKNQWLLDNRVYKGRVGFQVYSLFKPTQLEHQQVLVNRGWVVGDIRRTFLPKVPVPNGKLNLMGRLGNPGSVGIKLGDPEYASIAPLAILQHLVVNDLAKAKNINLYPYVLILDEGQPGGLQRDWITAKELSPAKHLGYAVQWFGLAVALVLIYLGVNTKRIRENKDE